VQATTRPAPGASPTLQRRAIRAVALFEACKGAIVLVGATGLLSLVHKDVDHFAARLIAHTHLNPASRFPHIFLDAASHVQQTHLVWLAAGAATYAVVRLIEAYGLFRERAWAEWLAALSGGLYVPLEVLHLVHRPGWLALAILVGNVAVVVVMVLAIVRRRRAPAVQAA